jgi:CHAT domain-containing protein
MGVSRQVDIDAGFMGAIYRLWPNFQYDDHSLTDPRFKQANDNVRLLAGLFFVVTSFGDHFFPTRSETRIVNLRKVEMPIDDPIDAAQEMREAERRSEMTDVRLLVYSVSVDRTRAMELGQGLTIEHDFGSSLALLDAYDGVQRELSSPAMLSRARLPSLEKFAGQWGRSLLPQTWLSNPPAHCVIIPHGLLHSLPMHVVRTDSGRPLCADSGVSVCSSLTLLKQCMERSPGHNGACVDPFLEDGAKPASSRWFLAGVDTLGASDKAWSRLPAELLAACGEDVDVCQAVAPAWSMREVVADALSGHSYELIIIAAHGYRNPLDALSSGFLLRRNDMAFRMRELDILGSHCDGSGLRFITQDLPVHELPPHVEPELPAELLSHAELERAAHILCPLVALLGCSTGRPVLYPGDQPVSLADLFLHIGAAAVVAPMWDVSVTAVRAWMQEFLMAYRNHGKSRSEAARMASRNRHEAGAALHDAGCLLLHGDYR